MKFGKVIFPSEGERIKVDNGKLSVSSTPVIPFIEGDGIGPDITRAALRVWDAAVNVVYGGKKKIIWWEIYAGSKAKKIYDDILPEDTLEAIRYCSVAIKGPLLTPVGQGYRSLNVSLRQKLDLYACVRPVYYIKGVPSPVSRPEDMDMVIFRENTEDVYAGIEWKMGSPEAEKIIGFLEREFSVAIRKDSGIGFKPISVTATKRLVRKALEYAIANKRNSLTLVHKGNIMKFTEGAFRDWGYETARQEFSSYTITEEEFMGIDGNSDKIKGKIIVKDRIADAMFQQVLTRPSEYDVIALPNLNGDYLSDACAAQIGGLGLAPGANLGDTMVLFEPCHGTAPKYANQDKVNPSALILSGVMMFEYLGWDEAAKMIKTAVAKTIEEKKVTYDLARLMDNAVLLSTSGFASAVIDNME